VGIDALLWILEKRVKFLTVSSKPGQPLVFGLIGGKPTDLLAGATAGLSSSARIEDTCWTSQQWRPNHRFDSSDSKWRRKNF